MADVIYQKNDELRGVKVIAANDNAIVSTMPGIGKGSQYTCENGSWFILTGEYAYYATKEEWLYFQTTSHWWVLINRVSGFDGWKGITNAAKIPSYSRNDVRRLVQGIINNNKRITENNLLCARYSHYFTKDQQRQIALLQQRVQERYDAITETGFCEDIEKGNIAGYSEYNSYLADLMKNEGIGIVWWAWLIIGFAVVGGLAGVSYFVYNDFFAESKDDVKFSDSLTKILKEKLTEEEYAQLEKETQGIVTKVKLNEKFGGIWKTVKYAAVAIGALFAFKFLTSSLDRIGKK